MFKVLLGWFPGKYKKNVFLPADNRDDQVYETNEEDETMNSPFDQSVNLSPEINNGDSPSAFKSRLLSPITIVMGEK